MRLFSAVARYVRLWIVKKLEPPDSHFLRAAVGWLELGNPREAQGELRGMAVEHAGHPDVLAVRWHIAAHEKHWEDCIVLAAARLRADPEEPEPWIQQSFALHELRRTLEAFDQLLPAAARFPSVWTIPYNLACYCAQLGRLKEGEDWFGRAYAIDATAARGAALTDPDLIPLLGRLQRLWRRQRQNP